MKYNFCGHSGLQLPAISLGLWHNFGDVDCFATMERTVRTAFDRGITHFDLADNYGPPPGSAESNFARIMARGLSAHRDEILVSSKAGHLMWDGPYGDGGSRKHLMAGINQSLKRTGLEYFDIFYSHRYCPETPVEETVQALIDIVHQGKALYVGLSKYPVEVARKACEMMASQNVRCLIYQDRYNMLSRNPEAEHLDFLRQQGLGFITFSPLAQGLLTDRYLNGIPAGSRAARESGFLKRETITPELVEKLRSLNAIAAGRGQSLAQMALAWLLHKPEVTSVLIGASSPAQLESNLEATESAGFTDEELGMIDEILAN
ncbi:MAG: aldo/keto reductase [Muribaculaceae bacterium]|nr:aldo/keto reductase [Muribaculaceae bacterium]